jgi:hypothetical protein
VKLDRSQPLRTDAEAPEALRAFARSGRGPGPSDAAVERMAKRLATAGVLSAPASPLQDAPRAESKFAYYKVGVLALAVASGLLVTWQATKVPPSSGTAVLSVDAHQATAPIPNAPAEPRPADQPVDVADAPKPVTISVDQLPSAAPAAAPRSARSSAESAGSKAPSTELELVNRAQVALASDPQRALTLMSEHARTYPNGEFVQEREVIAVEALSRLGRKEEALRRALALVQRFPRTPYAARLEVAVGRPVSPASSSAAPTAPDDRGSSPAAKAP